MKRIDDILKMNLGFYNKYIKEYKDAPYDEIVFYNDLIRYNPTNEYYLLLRGNDHMKNKRYRAAMRDYIIYLNHIDGGYANALVYYKLAQSFFYQGEGYYAQAYMNSEIAKKLRPDINLDPDFEKSLEYIVNSSNIKLDPRFEIEIENTLKSIYYRYQTKLENKK